MQLSSNRPPPNSPDLYTELLGVPPGPRPPNHYELLGLDPRESDSKKIRDAVVKHSAIIRQRAMNPRPGDAGQIHHMLTQLGLAAAELADPERRARYDRQLAALHPPAPRQKPPTPAAPVAIRAPQTPQPEPRAAASVSAAPARIAYWPWVAAISLLLAAAMAGIFLGLRKRSARQTAMIATNAPAALPSPAPVKTQPPAPPPTVAEPPAIATKTPAPSLPQPTIPSPEPKPFSYGLCLHFDISTFTGYPSPDLGRAPAKEFAPTNPDARQWARVAKQAGMDFAILTVKHEAGFCLWNSAGSDYNIASSPVRRDIVAEFIAACETERVVPGVLYSIPDAHHEGRVSFKAPVPPAYFDLIKQHLAELHTKYPGLRIQILNLSQRLTPEQFGELSDIIKRRNPACQIWDTLGGGIRGSRHAVATLSRNWFWTPNQSLAPLEPLLQTRARCRADGKAFVLNVPPDRTGRIPQECVDALMQLKTMLGNTNATADATAPAEDARFALTTGAYGETDDLDAAVKKEFGRDATVADWQEIKSRCATSGNARDFCDRFHIAAKQEAYINRDGNSFWRDNRRYFLARFDGDVPRTFLVHDLAGASVHGTLDRCIPQGELTSVGSQTVFFALGSWSGKRPVLARLAPEPKNNSSFLSAAASRWSSRKSRPAPS